MARKTQRPGKLGDRRFGLRRLQRGGTLVELALILPIFFLLIFGVLDFGRGIWAYNTLSYASREGVRYAIVRGSKSQTPASVSDIRQIVIAQTGGLDASKLTVTVTWLPNNSPGSNVKVQAQYNFVSLVPLLNLGTIALTSSSNMVITN
ncbi:MAG: TadE/TadG family type IV pilus assembly protein [Acidobacteriota bacterium]